MMNDFGKRLENLRDTSGYTKKEISFRLGFTANVYGSYERGDRRPSLETIITLADMYNVSLDYLIRGKEFQSHSDFTAETTKLNKLISYFHKAGFDYPYFLQLDKWKLLNEKDLQELSNHFEWVVDKARGRR